MDTRESESDFQLPGLAGVAAAFQLLQLVSVRRRVSDTDTHPDLKAVNQHDRRRR